ncbi:MAG: hypothetical protein KC933_03135 [Myxococcales bacterium]|nr:hypothetical protein [Myxococcales bacterium]MCB9648454.1 hypothetical protein [Deltaproteobacteria bacterium]
MARAHLTLTLAVVAACGPGSEGAPTLIELPLGEAVVGDALERAVPLANAWDHADAPAEISARATADGVTLVWRPRVPGPLAAEVRLLDADGALLFTLPVTGQARAPRLTVWPDPLPDLVGAPLWVWPETPVAITLDAPWASCAPDCIALDAPEADGGLPVQLSRGEGPAPAERLTLRACPHPDCEVQVRLQQEASGCTPAVLSLPAAVVGEVAEGLITCPGVPSSADPGLEVVPGADGVHLVRWRPTTVGPLRAGLDLPGGGRAPVLGYALEAPSCQVAVTPEALVFGLAPVGGSRTRQVNLRNDGAEPCLVAGASAGPAPAYQAPPALPRWLPAGATLELPITFSPPSLGPHDGQAILRAAGLTPERARIALVGEGVEADLYLLTDTVDLGRLAPCGQPTRMPIVANRGDAPGLILGARFEGPGGAALRVPGPLPMLVPAGGLLGIPLLVTPGSVGRLEATLWLELEGAGEVAVALDGEAVARPVVVDEHLMPSLNKVDLLVVLDDGPGLALRQDALRDAMADLAARVVDNDLHLAFMTASIEDPARTTRLLPPDGDSVLLGGDLPQLVADMQRTFDLVGARPAPRLGQGLAAVLEVLTSTVDGARFLRPDAFLSILAITAEDDASPGDVDDYLFALDRLKGPPYHDRMAVSALAGDPFDGCEAEDGFSAPAATRWGSAVWRTSGTLESICASTWFAQSGPTDPITARTRFPLSKSPDEATLVVMLDGAPVAPLDETGALVWSWAFGDNSVRFTPSHAPPPGTVVTLTYEERCP